MAFSTVWIAIASVLATFTISKKIDKDGNVIEPIMKYRMSSSWSVALVFVSNLPSNDC